MALYVLRNQGAAAMWRGASLAVFRTLAPFALSHTLLASALQTSERVEGQLSREASAADLVRINAMRNVLPSVLVTISLVQVETVRTALAVTGILPVYGPRGSRMVRAYRATRTTRFLPVLGWSVAHTAACRSIVFASYVALRDWKERPQAQLAERFVLAYGLVLAAETLCYPLDTMRRMAMLGQNTRMHALGLRALFRGASANVARSLIGAACVTAFGMYQPERYL